MIDKTELAASLTAHGVPQHLHEGAIRYVAEGVKPGGFLVACFENNFVDAMCRANGLEMIELLAIAKWIYNEAPARCWGSPGIVQTWRGQ